ncbi:MAG: diguanylate cyclase [Gammaproteobacteria bacterium]|nr:diguanylate cyclase [Gammaproteobacteria bacterium]
MEKIISPITAEVSQTILDNVVDGIISINERGIVLSFNKAAENIFGYSTEEVMGENIKLLMPEETQREHDQYIQNFLETGNGKIIGKGRQVVAKHKDGTPIYIHLSISQVNADTAPIFVGITRDITADVLIEQKTQLTNKLLNAISSAQSQFILETKSDIIFADLLNNIIDITGSEYGFVGQIYYDEDKPYLKTLSITNIAWDKATQTFYEDNVETGLEFRNLNTLFGYTIETGELLISNSPDTDAHKGGLPEGHPPLKAYIGLPIKHGSQLIGMVGLANRKYGYDQSVVDFLIPVLGTCGSIIQGIKQAAQEKQSQSDLKLANKELERRTSEINLIRKLDDYLQICRSNEEAFSVTRKILSDLFSNATGEIYTYSRSNDGMLLMEFWGENRKIEPIISNDDCIASRRGHTHVTIQNESALYCHHINSLTDKNICFPVQAQGETFGIISTSFSEREEKISIDNITELGETVARQLAMSLANLKLRDSLKEQSIKDPLTGLYNRRYIENSVEREIFRAERSGESISLLMFDVDHFKQFNDTYGHDTGDTVLKMISKEIGQHGRKSDIPCRFGGEEFLLILPGANIDIAQKRATKILQAVNELTINVGDKILDNLSISCGIAVYPDNGKQLQELFISADQALYASKKAGRNRITLAKDIKVKFKKTA